jgi:signal transduction histidine kinase
VRRFPKGEQLDRIVAGCLVVLGQIELWIGNAVPGPKGLAVPIAILMPLTIAFRRRRPLAAGSTVLIANAVLGSVGGFGTSLAAGVSWMCGIYAIAVWTDRTRFLAGVGVLVASNWIPYAVQGGDVQTTGVFTWVPILAMVLARGAVRGRQLQNEALAARSALLERERDLRAHEAVAEERARIARELHDLVAHNVSVMVIQAGAERHALPDGQESTRETLGSIEQAGRQALADARRLLGVLRRDGDREELAPQPGVADIAGLIEQVHRAGLSVSLIVDGEPRPLEAGLDLCAYRVVQEGLTNALKHAGRSQAELRLEWSADALVLEIRDDGTAGAAVVDGSGQGLIGMRERVALYGGELHAGPRDGGGFQIRARLPLS